MNVVVRRLGTVAAAAVMAMPALAIPASQANASGVRISAQAFGMHALGMNSSYYPSLRFGAARIWDMGLTWADLQPSQPVLPTADTTTWDQGVLSRLDYTVDTYAGRHVDPMITLGMTPAWASAGTGCTDQGYGLGPCPPAQSGAGSPWANYVTALATRYDGKHGHARVTYFELWNEPSLRNGWYGTAQQLVPFEKTAYSILHARGQRLLAPSIAFTNGSPTKGLSWLDIFLHSGGTSFDIAGFHLYPTDSIARANYGPEWAMDQLTAARKVLAKYGLNRPVWNTEVNVGRAQTNTTFSGTVGASQLARTLLLNLESGVQRTMWYASDDHKWGGTFVENGNHSLTAAGVAEKALYGLVVNGTANGCSRKTVGTHRWNYTCKFYSPSLRKNVLALWTTGSKYSYHGPSGTSGYETVTGARHSARSSTRLTISSVPVYVYGSFKL